jgi:hypothetical protein
MRSWGEFTNIKHLFRQRIDLYCQQVTYEVNSMPADFLAIATQRLVIAKYWVSKILPCAYSAQRRIGAGFRCLTG